MAKRLRVSKQVDRFSCLPTELLSRIISFLPIKDAVRASSVSTTWNNAFSSISNLDFEDCFTKRKWESDSYMDFVDGVLFSRTGVVDRFRLKCGKFVKSNRVDRWIRYALRNNVKDLDLWLDFKEFNGLPNSVFTCKTLVSLKLDVYNYKCKFVLKLPVKVCLPSLKVLHLSGIEFQDDDSIRRLFSSCYVLEELVITRCVLQRQCKFSVCSPTLKRLTIAYVGGFHNDYEITIDAPSLVYFRCGYLPQRFLVKNLNSVVKADIDFGIVSGFYFVNDAAGIDLLRGISNVQTLRSSCTVGQVFLEDSSIIPELPKLTYLNLDGNFLFGWERGLPHLLARFPCIEALVLKVKQQSLSDNSEVKLPSFLWSQLKKLTILAFKGTKNELHMVKHFLENAQVLEDFTVQTIAKNGNNADKWRSMITKNLLSLPKISKKCEVFVSFLT